MWVRFQKWRARKVSQHCARARCEMERKKESWKDVHLLCCCFLLLYTQERNAQSSQPVWNNFGFSWSTRLEWLSWVSSSRRNWIESSINWVRASCSSSSQNTTFQLDTKVAKILSRVMIDIRSRDDEKYWLIFFERARESESSPVSILRKMTHKQELLRNSCDLWLERFARSLACNQREKNVWVLWRQHSKNQPPRREIPEILIRVMLHVQYGK